MRELKFRAWDKLDNRMIVDEQGFIPLKVTNKGVLKLSPEHVDELWTIVNGDRFEMMQYTGLKDKNGKEIYEGDICETVTYSGKPFGTIDIVKFSGGAFKLTDIEDALLPIHLDDSDIQSIEVIGNIYENPYLVGGKHG